jgi:hypothetical protein
MIPVSNCYILVKELCETHHNQSGTALITVIIPSMMKSHLGELSAVSPHPHTAGAYLKPSRPPAPLTWPMPYAMLPPKAPARLQNATTMAILTARLSCGYYERA